MKFRVVIELDEDGIFVAECSTLPGCVLQGKTRAEALVNIKDAIEGYVTSLRKHDEPVPPPITEEVVEVGHEVTVRLAVPRDTANTFFLEQFAAKARVVRREQPPDGETGARVALEFEKELVLDLP